MSSIQCRPWSEVSFCNIWSGSTLFAQAHLSQYLGLLWYCQNLHGILQNSWSGCQSRIHIFRQGKYPSKYFSYFSMKTSASAHNKTYNKNCVTIKDSDQPVYSPSMARVLVYPSLAGLNAVEGICDQRRLIRLPICIGWSESLLFTQILL